MATESDFLEWVSAQQQPTKLVQLAAGDDLAVLDWPAKELLLVGVDQVLDGVHFDSAVHSPRAIGRKAMNRNLSDCAAMGCLPAGAVVSVALPDGCGLEYAKELYLGLREMADPFDCRIVGGDTGSWAGKLAITVTVLARSDGVAPVTRAGAKAGDDLYVTGRLGGSILGRHMDFMPRVEEGQVLARSGKVTAMMDLSDGLSRDLPRLCERSGVGALVFESKIPIHDDARKARQDGRSAIQHALHDGEDYELLFTANGTPPMGTLIGTITQEKLLIERIDGSREPLLPLAWEHSL